MTFYTKVEAEGQLEDTNEDAGWRRYERIFCWEYGEETVTHAAKLRKVEANLWAIHEEMQREIKAAQKELEQALAEFEEQQVQEWLLIHQKLVELRQAKEKRNASDANNRAIQIWQQIEQARRQVQELEVGLYETLPTTILRPLKPLVHIM